MSDLALRSKSYWPYSKALIESYREDLEVFPEEIEAGAVFAMEQGEEIVGFYALSSSDKKQRLHFMFVEPNYIGKGLGKALWLHALSTAKQRGWRSLSFYADSYAAENFYKHQGCRTLSTLESKLGPLFEMYVELI